MPTFGPLGEPIFHLYLAHTHTHTADLECTHSVVQYCYFGPRCQKPFTQDSELQTSVSEADWTSLELSGSPWPSFSPNTERMCQMFPLGTGDYLPRWQIDGSGPDAAHTTLQGYYSRGNHSCNTVLLSRCSCATLTGTIPSPPGEMFNYLTNYIRTALGV